MEFEVPPTPLHFTRLKDIFQDPRSEPRPSRFVRAYTGSPGSAKCIARNDDGTRCVVAGLQSLKIIRTRDPDAPSTLVQPPRSARLLATGSGSAQLYEDLNVWNQARPTENYNMINVSWGTGTYSNKIVTACASGDIVLWDIHKSSSKIEKVYRREHDRSVSCVAFAPLLPGLFMTGSHDTTVKVFDLRKKGTTRTFTHSATVRAIAFSPFQPTSTSSINDILVGTEGGDLVRWDIRFADKPLDRKSAAHKGGILGIDWVASSESGGMRSWVCTGGVDKTVKVWAMSPSGIEPRHMLHTPHPVGHVEWRPSASSSQQYQTDLLVVPLTPGVSPGGVRGTGVKGPEPENLVDVDKDRPSIWDVRRHHVPKYVLLGGEGAVADAVWTSSDTICTVYRNGNFVRHDVAHSYAPLYDPEAYGPPSNANANANANALPAPDPAAAAAESIPQSLRGGSLNRHALAWDPMGGIAFMSGFMSPGEIPFDDVPSAIAQALSLHPKTPAEAPYESTQVAGHATGPIGSSIGPHRNVANLDDLRQLARSYRLYHGKGDVSRQRVAEQNAEIAMRSGDVAAAQLWDRLAALLGSEPEVPEPVAGADSASIAPPASSAPITPAHRFEILPSVSPDIHEAHLGPMDGEAPLSRLTRTPSVTMLKNFVFGMPTALSKGHLDRVAPQTPTPSPTSSSPPSAIPSNPLEMGRYTGNGNFTHTSSTGPRRSHQRAVSAAGAVVPPRSQSPTARTTTSSRSLSRLGRRVSRPRPPEALTVGSNIREVPPLSPTPTPIRQPDLRRPSPSGSTELRRKNGIIPISMSSGSRYDYTPRRSVSSSNSSVPPQRSPSITQGSHHHRRVSSSEGRRSERAGSRSVTGSSETRSRSHSITSTTAFLALQDDITESSEGDNNRDRDRPVEADDDTNAVSRPPSPVMPPTVAPIFPSPLFQTITASSSSLESQAGRVIADGLARVDEVAEPSSLRSSNAAAALHANLATIRSISTSSIIRSPLVTRSSSAQSQHRTQSPRYPEDRFFASDDGIDADDNYDPSSSAEDVENSPRPHRPVSDFGRKPSVPDFSLDPDADTEADDDDDEEYGGGEDNVHLARHFSESSMQTAVQLHRHGSGNGADAMYASFRIQKSQQSSTASISRSRSRRGSLIRQSSSRILSNSHSQSRSVSRSRATSHSRTRSMSRGRTDKVNSIARSGQSSRSVVQQPTKDIKTKDPYRRDDDNESLRGRQRRRRQPAIELAEKHFREVGWASFRERVEEEIDSGNVQLASLLILVGGDEVLRDSLKSQTLVESYVAMLDRLRLHTSAAIVRKGTMFRNMREITMIDTTIYSSCGICHKSFIGPPPGSRSTTGGGKYQYCPTCKANRAQCAICHLPVYGLMFMCQGCSHGGHQECYRKYIASRPPATRRLPKPEPPTLPESTGTAGLPRTRSFAVTGVSSRSPSTVGSSQAIASLVELQQQMGREPHISSGPLGGARPSPPADESPRADSGGLSRSWRSTGTSGQPLSEKRPVRYYCCPSGCGHYCWASNLAL